MTSFLLAHYPWILALHVIAMTAWMAGMLYLPRLYVYHADATKGSDASEMLKVMERRLLRAIINPAMIVTILLGLTLVALQPAYLQQGWLHVKLTCVALLILCHIFFARWRRQFAHDANTRPARFYRMWNEVPTLLLIVIVIMAVVKPF